jgi:hypothetical protein
MTHVALITVENVLAAGDDLKTALPLKWGKSLYDGMRASFHTVALTRATDEIARWWLGREGLGSWSAVLSSVNSPMTYEDWRVDQVRDFLSNAWDVGFLLDYDNSVIERVRELGVLTLTLGAPHHPPGWKDTTQTFKPWTDVSLVL